MSVDWNAMEVETKFLRLRQPVEWGHNIDGWRVCWLGGWDKGRVFYVVMAMRVKHEGRMRPKKSQSVAK
jgi:hypothetical protein